MDKSNSEKGFSLIELLIVVVVIGVVAAFAVPAYQKGIRAAENGAVFALMRIVSSNQVQYFASNSRFGTLPEINAAMSNQIGVTTGDRVVRGLYVFEMSPIAPTPAELRQGYAISAVRSVDGVTYRYELNQSGRITRVLPVGAPQD